MSQLRHPRLSVLFPVYNSQKTLRSAMGSLLQQTFTDFEILALDDASTDQSTDVLHSFQDPRIRILTSSQNLGLVANLNRGLELARGEWIARMDSDDLSHPDRFLKQLQFLEDHHLDWTATPCWLWDENQKKLKTPWLPPLSPESLRAALHFRNPVPHGSVIVRSSALKKLNGYLPDAFPAEDQELWLRLSRNYRAQMMTEPLFVYRLSSESITGKKQNSMQQKMTSAIANSAQNLFSQKHWSSFLWGQPQPLSKQEMEAHLSWMKSEFSPGAWESVFFAHLKSLLRETRLSPKLFLALIVKNPPLMKGGISWLINSMEMKLDMAFEPLNWVEELLTKDNI